jgi:hypothetical protein
MIVDTFSATKDALAALKSTSLQIFPLQTLVSWQRSGV